MKIIIDNGHSREAPGKRSPDAALLVSEQEDITLAERCRRVNELTLPEPRLEHHHPHLHPRRRRRQGRPLVRCHRLVRLHHPWRHPCRWNHQISRGLDAEKNVAADLPLPRGQ